MLDLLNVFSYIILRQDVEEYNTFMFTQYTNCLRSIDGVCLCNTGKMVCMNSYSMIQNQRVLLLLWYCQGFVVGFKVGRWECENARQTQLPQFFFTQCHWERYDWFLIVAYQFLLPAFMTSRLFYDNRYEGN